MRYRTCFWKLGEISPLLLVEHEVEDLPFLAEGCGEDQISLFESWEGSSLAS